LISVNPLQAAGADLPPASPRGAPKQKAKASPKAAVAKMLVASMLMNSIYPAATRSVLKDLTVNFPSHLASKMTKDEKFPSLSQCPGEPPFKDRYSEATLQTSAQMGMFKSFQQHAEEQSIENYEEFFFDYDRPYQFSQEFYNIYDRIKAKMTKKQLTMYTNLKSCLESSTAREAPPPKRAFI